MKKSKKTARRSLPLLQVIAGFIILSLVISFFLRGKDVALLNPKGFVAREQLDLMLISTFIMVVFAAVVLFFLYFFAWRYRETNTKATYNHSSHRGKISSLMIWAIPSAVCVLLVSIMIPATHKLEPQKEIVSDKDTLNIQVIALRWKWLFIYPEQDIASVNVVHIPVDRPVQFELTGDEAPMNSFWIPHLGGMLYAMTEHVNRLNLIADTPGEYEGSAAEINGHGFADMRFTTRVTDESSFNAWVEQVKQSAPTKLDMETYSGLLEPTEDHPINFYSSYDKQLYDKVLAKYAGSHSSSHGAHSDSEATHSGGSH